MTPINQNDTAKSVPAPEVEAKIVERRRSERFPFSAVAELVEPLSLTRMAVRIADISVHGCYADGLNSMPVGTKVVISIAHANAQFKTGASVSYSLPGMGMGLSFEELSPKMASILSLWIADVQGETSPVLGAAEVEAAVQNPQRVERHILGRLISLMTRKNLLTQSEGTELLDELLHED